MTPSPKKYILKTTDGEYVIVRKCSNGICLSSVDSQEEHWVTVCTRERNDKKQMALLFPYTNRYCLPNVNGTSTQLEMTLHDEIVPTDKITDDCWFEKGDEDSSSKFSLQTVGTPRKYLKIITEKHTFTLTDAQSDAALVTLEDS